MAEATQEYHARQSAQMVKNERLSFHAQSPTEVKLRAEAQSGYGAEYTPPQRSAHNFAVPERVTGQIVVEQG